MSYSEENRCLPFNQNQKMALGFQRGAPGGKAPQVSPPELLRFFMLIWDWLSLVSLIFTEENITWPKSLCPPHLNFVQVPPHLFQAPNHFLIPTRHCVLLLPYHMVLVSVLQEGKSSQEKTNKQTKNIQSSPPAYGFFDKPYVHWHAKEKREKIPCLMPKNRNSRNYVTFNLPTLLIMPLPGIWHHLQSIK